MEWAVWLWLLTAGSARVDYLHIYQARPVQDKRVLVVLGELCRKGSIRVPVRMYHSALTPHRAFIVRVRQPLHAAIVLSDETLRTFSRPALRGLLAHELGHLAYGHINEDDWDNLEDRERKVRQHQADAFAIRVAGRDAVYVCLRSQGSLADCARYIDYIDAALNKCTIVYDPDDVP